MPWIRPSNVPFPSIWHKFEGKIPLSDGTLPKFRVQDLTEDQYDEVLDLMCTIFLSDEPICKFSDYLSCQKSVEFLKEYWKRNILQKVTLVCVLDDIINPNEKPIIVGLNMTYVCCGDEEHFTPSPGVDKWNQIITTMVKCEETCDVYKKYNVSCCLTAAGLLVKPEYRGQGVGLEILKARVPLCKAVGLELTATVFTAVPSQILAERCGFDLLGEIIYKDLENIGLKYPGITTPSAKWMAMRIIQ